MGKLMVGVCVFITSGLCLEMTYASHGDADCLTV